MNHRASPRFRRCYDKLPEDVRRLADKCYTLLKENPHHPSLHLKEVGRLWSVRVGLHFRAVGVEEDSDLVWFWIGSHAEYDKIVGRG